VLPFSTLATRRPGAVVFEARLHQATESRQAASFSLPLRLVRFGVVVDLAEVDEDTRLVTDDPGVVPGSDVNCVTRAAFAFAAVIHQNVHPSRHHIAEVRRLATVGARDRLHVLRPTPTRLEHTTTNRPRAEIDQTHPAVTDLAEPPTNDQP